MATVEKDSNAEIAVKRMQLSRDYTQPYFDRFLDNYKHYFLRLIDEAVEADPDAYPFYSQSMLPISYQIVETILPRMFSRLPNFSITTEEENDEKDELALQNLIKYQIQHPYLIDDPVFVRLMMALKEEFITGNAWGVVPWYLKDVTVEEWQPYSISMGIEQPSWDNLEKIKAYGREPDWKLVKVKRRVIDAPVFDHKSVFHVFPDPKKKRVSQLGYVLLEDDMTMEQIRDMVAISPRQFKDIDKIADLQPLSSDSSKWTNYDQEMAGIFGGEDFTSKDDTQKQYKVWIMQEREKYSIIVNETLTIRESDNPNGNGDLGVFLMKDIPVPHELYAWGEPDPIKKMEDAMTDQANMRNDSVFYDLLKMWKVDPNGLVDGEDFIPEPGVIVQVKDMAAIQTLDTGTTSPTAYKEYQSWEQVIQNVSGVSDYSTGQNSPGMNKTLGGIELLQQAANARFSLKLQLFEQLGLKAMGSMYVQRNLRFFDSPQSVPTEQGKLKVDPGQLRRIRGPVHFIVDTGSTEAIAQTTEQTKWTAIVNMIGKPPFDNLSREALDEIGTKVLYALRVPNADELMKHDQQGEQTGGFTNEQLQTIVQLVKQLMQKMGDSKPADDKAPSESLNYKDVPPDIQRQMEAAAGYKPSGTQAAQDVITAAATQQTTQGAATQPTNEVPVATAPVAPPVQPAV